MGGTDAEWTTQAILAALAGTVASVCFTLQYLPQAWLNYQRQSVKGFNTVGIIIKFVGACFLTVNAYLTGEQYPVILYGLFNVLQHSLFMFQFWLYGDGQRSRYLAWLLFPVIPMLMGLMECARLRTTSGVSLLSQHLNGVGGLLGLYMLSTNPPIAATTYLLYINSCFQAFSIYALAISFGEFSCIRPRKLDKESLSQV